MGEMCKANDGWFDGAALVFLSWGGLPRTIGTADRASGPESFRNRSE